MEGTVISLHGCFVQCWTCWGGAHSKCETAACQCQGKTGLTDRRVQELHERQSHRPNGDNRNPRAHSHFTPGGRAR